MWGHSRKCVFMSQALPACCMPGKTYTPGKMRNLLNYKHHKNKYLEADVCVSKSKMQKPTEILVGNIIPWQEMKSEVCCVFFRCCARAARLSEPGARVAAEQAAAVIAAGWVHVRHTHEAWQGIGRVDDKGLYKVERMGTYINVIKLWANFMMGRISYSVEIKAVGTMQDHHGSAKVLTKINQTIFQDMDLTVTSTKAPIAERKAHLHFSFQIFLIDTSVRFLRIHQLQ